MALKQVESVIASAIEVSLVTPLTAEHIPGGMGVEVSRRLDAFQQQRFDEAVAAGKISFMQPREHRVAPGIIQRELDLRRE